LIRRISAIVKKELRQLKRDIRLLFVMFFFPVFLLMIFGYAINFDVKHIKLAILDNDKSIMSRDFINSLLNSEYFDLVNYIEGYSEVDSYLDEKIAHCVVVIPNDFSKKIYSGQVVQIQYLIDGVDANTAAIIRNYVTAATLLYSKNILSMLLTRQGIYASTPVSLEPQFWFNPDLDTTKFLIPGLIAVILIVTAVITVALSFVREKERGTMEQLNVSSLSSIELILGKTFPFVIIALINAGFILSAGYILFGVEVKGSLILLFITTLVFLSASTSIGIFVSVIADSQQFAFSLATFLSLLPSVILSGFIFPIDSMPIIIQIITNVTPAKFFIEILRAIVLRGVGLTAFWEEIIYLIIYTIILMSLSTLINKKRAQI
jgi:ABC-2 type transport system permease protein